MRPLLVSRPLVSAQDLLQGPVGIGFWPAAGKIPADVDAGPGLGFEGGSEGGHLGQILGIPGCQPADFRQSSSRS